MGRGREAGQLAERVRHALANMVVDPVSALVEQGPGMLYHLVEGVFDLVDRAIDRLLSGLHALVPQRPAIVGGCLLVRPVTVSVGIRGAAVDRIAELLVARIRQVFHAIAGGVGSLIPERFDAVADNSTGMVAERIRAIADLITHPFAGGSAGQIDACLGSVFEVALDQVRGDTGPTPEGLAGFVDVMAGVATDGLPDRAHEPAAAPGHRLA